MKNRFMIICFSILFLTPLFGQEILLEKFLPANIKGTNKVLIDENRIIITQLNAIYLYDLSTMECKKILEVKKGLIIWPVDYYENMIVYVYGKAWTSMISLIDLKTRENRDLHEIENEWREKYDSLVFKDVYWVDDENILYTIWNPESDTDELKKYNLITKRTELIMAKDFTLIDYNRKENIAIYAISDKDNKVIYRMLNMNDGSEKEIAKKYFSNMVIVSKNIYLGFIARDPEYGIFLIENDNLTKIDSTYNLAGARYYPEFGYLVASYKIGSNPLTYRIGLFRLSLNGK